MKNFLQIIILLFFVLDCNKKSETVDIESVLVYLSKDDDNVVLNVGTKTIFSCLKNQNRI